MGQGHSDMQILDFFRRDKLKRFVTAVRQEGGWVAVKKTAHYVTRELAGHGRSAFGGFGTGVRRAAPQSYLGGFWQEAAQGGAFHIAKAPATLGPARRIAMIGDLNLPQCRKYRVQQLAGFWAAQGVAYDYADYNDTPRAVAILQNASHAMFYRTQASALTRMYLYEARRLRLPVLYDLDDPLFSVSAYETYHNMEALPAAMKAHFVAEAPRYLDAMNLADIVTVSTPGLAEHARLYCPRPVLVRRNFADAETLRIAGAVLAQVKKDPKSPFRVAFTSGSMGHEIDFALIGAEIAGFLDASPNRQLVILGHFDLSLLPDALQGRVEIHAFADYPDYLQTLASVDCAVMPLADDIFNRCKSGVRVLDAAAVAVPSLVGPVGDMANIVRHGETGMVAGPQDSWRAALETLASDRAATRRMGQAARADLQENWSVRADQPIADPALLDWVMA